MSRFRMAVIIIGLIVVGVVAAWMAVPTMIGHTLSEQMKVEVTIRDVSLSPSQIKVKDVKIVNPEGSHLPTALSVGSISLSASLTNYVKQTRVIDEVVIDNIYFSLEFMSATNPKGNWGTILGNLKSGEKKEKGSGTLLIKKLVIRNLNADLVYRLQGNKVKKLSPISQIELHDISTDEGVGLEQVVVLLLDETLQEAIKEAGLPALLEQVIQSSKEALDSLTNTFKGLMN